MTVIDICLYILYFILIVCFRFVNHLLNYYLLTYLFVFLCFVSLLFYVCQWLTAKSDLSSHTSACEVTTMWHYINLILSPCFNGHFPGEPGLTGVYWSKGWWKWWWQLDYWSYKSCKAPVKSTPSTNQHQSI